MIDRYEQGTPREWKKNIFAGCWKTICWRPHFTKRSYSLNLFTSLYDTNSFHECFCSAYITWLDTQTNNNWHLGRKILFRSNKLKMKFSISLMLSTTLIVISMELNEAHYYEHIIDKIHKEYDTTGVTIISGHNDLCKYYWNVHFPFNEIYIWWWITAFEHITVWYEVVSRLSDKGIAIQIINFTQYEDSLKIRNHYNGRSLIVIAIATIEELHTVESITEDLYISYSIWLIFFRGHANKNVCDFCLNPHGSLANAGFAAKVLVACCNSSEIEEWKYSVDNHTNTQKQDSLRHGQLVKKSFPNGLVNDGRYSLNGQVLRVAAVEVNKSKDFL